MALHLTPEILERGYNLLIATDPFRRWRLPPASEIRFVVTNTQGLAGEHVYDGVHTVKVSRRKHHQLASVLMTMAHELVHIKDALDGIKSEHGRSFHKRADQVCRVHGFDRGAF